MKERRASIAPHARLLPFLVAFAVHLAAAAATIDLNTAAASCRVDLDGARVLSLRIGGAEMLWNADPLQTDAPDWAHGGIPVCWPRFGVDETGKIHGVAWRRPFAVRRHSAAPLRDELVLGLCHGQVSLEYSIALTDRLTLEMCTTNAGTNDFMCSFGFHPYLRVAERDRAVMDGVDSLAFEDDPSCRDPRCGVWHGPLGIIAPIDRIFRLPDAARRGEFTLHDRAGGRRVAVVCEGASHLNVWNPGAEKNCPGNVPGDEWRRFVCVEPILVGGADGRPLPIRPGEARILKMTIRDSHFSQR